MLLLLLVGVSVAILLTVISNSRTEHHLTGANPADRPRLRELVSEKCGVPVQYLYFVRYVSPSERIPNIDGTLRVGFTVFDNGNPYDAYAIDDTLVTRCDYGD